MLHQSRRVLLCLIHHCFVPQLLTEQLGGATLTRPGPAWGEQGVRRSSGPGEVRAAMPFDDSLLTELVQTARDVTSAFDRYVGLSPARVAILPEWHKLSTQ